MALIAYESEAGDIFDWLRMFSVAGTCSKWPIVFVRVRIEHV